MPIIQQIMSCNAGELTPRLNYRNDFAKFQSGCRKLENFLSTPHGAAIRRPGLDIITDITPGYDAKARLVPMQISTDHHIVLVLANGLATVTADGALVMADDAPVVFEIPWTDDDLAVLKYRQINDVIFFAHPDYPPYRLDRTDDYNWSLYAIDFGTGSPVLPMNTVEAKQIVIDYQSDTTPVEWTDGDTYYPGSRVYLTGFPLVAYVCQAEHIAEDDGNPPDGYGRYLGPPSETMGEAGYYVVAEEGPNGIHQAFYPLWIKMQAAENPIPPGTAVAMSCPTHDIWTDAHVGSVWRFDRRREPDKYESLIDMTAGYQAVSAPIEVQGVWNMDTNGNWYGTLKIQISEDEGFTWTDHKTYTSNATYRRNVSSTGETDRRVLMRLSYTSVSTGDSSPYAILSAADSDIAGWVRITDVTDSRHATGQALSHIKSMQTYRWYEGAWSDYQGYPRCVELHQARLCYAGTNRRPHTIWGSATDDYANFSGGTKDDDSWAHTLVIGERDPINWMISDKFLVIGSGAAEFILTGKDEYSPVTPQSGTARRQSTLGCDDRGMCAIPSETVPLFIQRGGDRIHELNYMYDDDRFVASNLCLLADHIHRDKVISDMALQRVPFQIVWAVDDSGQLSGYTYERRNDVTGWHRHTTEGGLFKAVCVCRGNDSEDHVYVMVKRQNSFTLERFGRGNIVSPAFDQTWGDYSTLQEAGPSLSFPDANRYDGMTINAVWGGRVWTCLWTAGEWVSNQTGFWFEGVDTEWAGKFYPEGTYSGVTRYTRPEPPDSTARVMAVLVDGRWTIYSNDEIVGYVGTNPDAVHLNNIPVFNVDGTEIYNSMNKVILTDPASLGNDLVFTGMLDGRTDITSFFSYELRNGKPHYHSGRALYSAIWKNYLGMDRWCIEKNYIVFAFATTDDQDITACTFELVAGDYVAGQFSSMQGTDPGTTYRFSLPYNSTYMPMPISLAMANGTSRSREARIHRVSVDLESSYGGWYGQSSDSLVPIWDDMSQHTGETELSLASSYDTTGDIVISANAPAPFILRGLVVKLNILGDTA